MSNEYSVGRVILDANWYLQTIIVRGKRPLEIHNARNVQYKIPFRDVDKTIRLLQKVRVRSYEQNMETCRNFLSREIVSFLRQLKFVAIYNA